MTNAEIQVAELLKNPGIYWIYEKPVYIKDDHERPRVWNLDFYLASFGIYVEVCDGDEISVD